MSNSPTIHKDITDDSHTHERMSILKRFPSFPTKSQSCLRPMDSRSSYWRGFSKPKQHKSETVNRSSRPSIALSKVEASRSNQMPSFLSAVQPTKLDLDLRKPKKPIEAKTQKIKSSFSHKSALQSPHEQKNVERSNKRTELSYKQKNIGKSNTRTQLPNKTKSENIVLQETKADELPESISEIVQNAHSRLNKIENPITHTTRQFSSNKMDSNIPPPRMLPTNLSKYSDWDKRGQEEELLDFGPHNPKPTSGSIPLETTNQSAEKQTHLHSCAIPVCSASQIDVLADKVHDIVHSCLVADAVVATMSRFESGATPNQPLCVHESQESVRDSQGEIASWASALCPPSVLQLFMDHGMNVDDRLVVSLAEELIDESARQIARKVSHDRGYNGVDRHQTDAELVDQNQGLTDNQILDTLLDVILPFAQSESKPRSTLPPPNLHVDSRETESFDDIEAKEELEKETCLQENERLDSVVLDRIGELEGLLQNRLNEMEVRFEEIGKIKQEQEVAIQERIETMNQKEHDIVRMGVELLAAKENIMANISMERENRNPLESAGVLAQFEKVKSNLIIENEREKNEGEIVLFKKKIFFFVIDHCVKLYTLKEGNPKSFC